MKKLLFLVTKEWEEDHDLFFAAAKSLGIQLDISTYEKIQVEYAKNESVVKAAGRDLTSYDLVYIQNGSNFSETQMLVSEFCLDHHILIFDPAFRHTKAWIDRKSFAYLRLSQTGLPIIPSLFISRSSFSSYHNHFAYPLVAKTTNGSRGLGVFLCHTVQQVEKLFLEHPQLMLQEYIPNQGDIRVIVIGDQVIGSILRERVSDEFRNNVALGATCSSYDLDEKGQEIAVKATKCLDYSISGVDLVYDQQQQEWKIIEVNSAPKFKGFMQATGIHVPEKILNFLVAQIPDEQ